MANPARIPRDNQEPSEPETAKPERTVKPTPRRPIGRRGLIWLAVLGVVALILVLVASHFDEYLRRTLEAKMNQHLKGYTVSVGHAHLNPFSFSLTLKELVIRQQANPEPPVADVPRLKMSVEWTQLLTFHLVGDAVFNQPRVHVNLPQLLAESRDPTKVRERGWQQALESIYPLKFNLVAVRDGDVVYVDEDPSKPLHISHFNLTASNIRNIQSQARTYPSPIHADGVIFDTGRGVVDGNADFLAEPFPGVHVVYKVQNVPLDRLRPLSAKANLSLQGGTLASNGEVEYGPRHKEVQIADVTVRGLDLDYVHSAATASAEKAREKKVAAVARNPRPPVPVLIRRLLLTGSKVGVVNRSPDHPFHLFVDGAELEVTNISTGFRNGPTRARLTGRFMGSGTAHGNATFRDAHNGPDFNFLIAVENAKLPALNELLRSYGKLDVADGKFSVYSEVKVHDGRIDGYVKPLFKDVEVYDPKQDKDKPVLKKLYEKVVGGVAHVLENHRGEDATVADLSGPLSQPHTSTWEVVTNLVSNAFVKAILPGFEKEFEAARKRR
ncbi:MAG TPA: DUF748 domain-containing protein [Thermoanaerobaculia bacterium]|nr:DUF748 domain-containing protein [Thermoanaerobaculia bacterium]